MSTYVKGIIHKHSATAGAVPTPDQLRAAELAINLADLALYTKDHNGNVVPIGGGSPGAPGGSYSLPAASPTVRGGIRVGSGLAINGDVLSATQNIDLGTF